jgi:lysophospholipase L1-like esterase
MKKLISLSIVLYLFPILANATTKTPNKEIAPPDSQHIVMVGASYLKGWPLTDIACLPVVNKGVSGETSTQVRARFETDAISSNPKAIIIWGHINDFSKAPKAKELQTRQTAIENLKFMIDHTLSNGIIPVIATEITFGVPSDIVSSMKRLIGNIMGKRSYQDYISTNVMAINEWIRNYASQQGIAVLEIEKLMTNEDGYRKDGYYMEDFSHISELAYQDLQAFAHQFLQQNLVEKHKLCK